MKAKPLLYMSVALLLVISVTFIMMGSSPRTLNLTDKINGLSYNLGLQLGKKLVDHNIDINMALFLSGLNAGRHDQQPLLTNEQIGQSRQIVMMIIGCQASEKNSKAESYDEFMSNHTATNQESISHRAFEY